MNRREFIQTTSLASAGLIVPQISSCTFNNRRGFYVDAPFEWSPKSLVMDIGFIIVGGLIDYLDARFEGKNLGIRIFNTALTVLDLASMVICPECSFGRRLLVFGSKNLLSLVSKYATDMLLALPEGNGYFVHLVNNSDGISIPRSFVSYGIKNREPYGFFKKQISAVPDLINYFTQVNGARNSTRIYHVWRRNGVITDRIPLLIESNNYRTWSNKVNLDTGLWTVTTENSNGHILDAKMFQINSYSARLRQISS